ncbi:hypothetical protein ACH4T9_13075 [Micromonospora sp. NPDC020750]|uniref:hypothetical protein n=1 Tax=unclassified Micromonospora TaxID=2617518 RepID=UPI0037B250C0
MTLAEATEPDVREVIGRHGGYLQRGADGWHRLNRAYVPTGPPMTWEQAQALYGPLTLPPQPAPEGSILRPEVAQALIDIADGVVYRQGRSAVNARTGLRCTQAVNRVVDGGVGALGEPDAQGVRWYELTEAARELAVRLRDRKQP